MAGFVFFDSYDAALRNLPDEDRLALYDAMCAFAFRGEEPSLSPLNEAFFALIKPTIEKSIERREIGKKGGRPKKENIEKKIGKNISFNQEKTQRRHREETETETEEIPAAKPPRAPRFTPPSLDEVRGYCLERKNNVNAEQFVDFYSAKGWRVGNQTMRDWRAAVRTWERREQADGKPENDKKYDYSNDVDFLGR